MVLRWFRICPSPFYMSGTSQPAHSENVPSGSPYCSDPNCQSCKDLKEVQEAIRLRQPIPIRKVSTDRLESRWAAPHKPTSVTDV